MKVHVSITHEYPLSFSYSGFSYLIHVVSLYPPYFRLFMVTDDPVSSVPLWIASLCSVVVFHPQCTGLESLLLEEFLSIHNQKTFLERHQLRIVSIHVHVHDQLKSVTYMYMYIVMVTSVSIYSISYMHMHM